MNYLLVLELPFYAECPYIIENPSNKVVKRGGKKSPYFFFPPGSPDWITLILLPQSLEYWHHRYLSQQLASFLILFCTAVFSKQLTYSLVLELLLDLLQREVLFLSVLRFKITQDELFFLVT